MIKIKAFIISRQNSIYMLFELNFIKIFHHSQANLTPHDNDDLIFFAFNFTRAARLVVGLPTRRNKLEADVDNFPIVATPALWKIG